LNASRAIESGCPIWLSGASRSLVFPARARVDRGEELPGFLSLADRSRDGKSANR
jgi:hypothetical protein